jgi:hypothetical protein
MSQEHFPISKINNAGEKLIEKSLTAKRVGFEQISVNILEKIFLRAPEGEIFTVPDERHKLTYENIAKIMKREDLSFLVGK